MCFGSIPPDNANWPSNRSPVRFPNLYLGRANMQLCAAGNAPINVGCKCETPGFPPLCSPANGGDQVLFDWVQLDPTVASDHTNFVSWCRDACICRSAATAEPFQEADPAAQAVQEPNDLSDITQGMAALDPSALDSESSSSDAGNDTNQADSVADQQENAEQINSTTADAHSPGSQCSAGACSIGQACSGTNCLCQVTAAQYVPGAGTSQYYAECGLRLNITSPQTGPFSEIFGSSSGGSDGGLKAVKRGQSSEAPACPCNTTYVSHSCCDAESGIVWEAPELKLGEMAKDWDL